MTVVQKLAVKGAIAVCANAKCDNSFVLEAFGNTLISVYLGEKQYYVCSDACAIDLKASAQAVPVVSEIDEENLQLEF